MNLNDLCPHMPEKAKPFISVIGTLFVISGVLYSLGTILQWKWVCDIISVIGMLFLILLGVLFLLGAVFRWKWACDVKGNNVKGLPGMVHRVFGEMGHRVVTGASGVVFILCGVVLLVMR